MNDPTAPVQAQAATGFDPGPVWTPDQPSDAPDPGASASSDETGGGLFDGLLGDGKPVTHQKAVDWLQETTGALDAAHGGPNGRIKADLRMTDREASWVAAGLVEWSQRTDAIGMVVDPPPTWKAAAGLVIYGWRVRGEHAFSVELEADAAQGAAHLRAIEHDDHPGDTA